MDAPCQRSGSAAALLRMSHCTGTLGSSRTIRHRAARREGSLLQALKGSMPRVLDSSILGTEAPHFQTFWALMRAAATARSWIRSR
eukprot:7812630-Pyramimonas_sp.AAC.1